MNRIDNVKTAISRGAGAWGTIHPTYRAYADTVGFHIDACSPRAPQAKGKAEAKVKLGRRRLDPGRQRHEGLEGLQAWTDARIDRWARTAVCPATGETVHESWRRELEWLRPLPILPEPFDVVVTRRVERDCLVAFEGRQYAVPFAYADQTVEVRGCAGIVQILADGRILISYPRGTKERLLMDPACFEGTATDRVRPPTPLGLAHAAERLGELLTEAVKKEVPAHRFLDRLLEAELHRREERRIKTSLRLSGLPPGYTLADFDWAFQPSVEKSQIETLATCAWIRERETLLIQGPPGVGKTHLGVALGVKAVENGFSVAFFRLDNLLHALKQDAEVPPQRLRRKKYMNVALLIIDEVGFQPLTRQEASLLFRLVSYRYERGSILITTNKAVKDWPEVLAGDEVMAAALLDRLLHRCHVLNIKGRSYRLRGLERLAK